MNAMLVTETIDHGEYHHTSLPVEVHCAQDVADVFGRSPYYRNHAIGDATLLQTWDDLARYGRAEFGWSTLEVYEP